MEQIVAGIAEAIGEIVEAIAGEAGIGGARETGLTVLDLKDPPKSNSKS